MKTMKFKLASLIIASAFILIGCEKEDDSGMMPDNPPAPSTNTIVDIASADDNVQIWHFSFVIKSIALSLSIRMFFTPTPESHVPACPAGRRQAMKRHLT